MHSQMFFGHDVGTGDIYEDTNIKVTAVENRPFAFHDVPADKRYRSYSYRFTTKDGVIVFTGDTGASGSVTELARKADLLVRQTVSAQDQVAANDC
jgi:ribonuclease BN (tRNA processing enzyme)